MSAPTHQGTRAGRRSWLRSWLLPAAFLALAALAVAAVFGWVDLSPKVESDFFFSTNDPQLETSAEIERLFPSRPQILVRAAAGPETGDGSGGLGSEAYLERLRNLTAELGQLSGVEKVYSLTQGPPNPRAVAESPFWRRLLLGEDGRSSLLVVQVAEDAGGALVAQVEALLARLDGPEFVLDASGVPVVLELIRRQLVRDLRTFSLAALGIFLIAVAWIFRSVPAVVGTLTSCLLACALTLLLLKLQAVPIGLLTANIVTIVFVLTLSHVVFLTAAWQRRGSATGAVAETFRASFWCMVTTVLGFSSLLFASARPLRELGNAGVVGTLTALAVAYAVYPRFLSAASRKGSAAAVEAAGEEKPSQRPIGSGLRGRWVILAALLLTAVAALGVPRLETDPSLLAYFEKGSELRRGLEAIDETGGSSPLSLVVAAPGGGPLVEGEALEKMKALQQSLEEHPAVGTVLSLPVLLEEGRRNPLAAFLGPRQLVALLTTSAFGSVARNFVTEDFTLGQYVLRMREGAQRPSRRQVVEDLEAQVRSHGLEPRLVGGLYDLQGRLAQLIRRSLLFGLAALLLLFAGVAALVARQLGPAAAMLACLVAVPVLVLGTLGHLGLPLDVIASPAVNVALALGVDSMIHLVLARRRLADEGHEDAWQAARRRMQRPILAAAAILAGGFGIFALSSFPPTRNFGVAVVVGTVASAALALWVLPKMTNASSSEEERRR